MEKQEHQTAAQKEDHQPIAQEDFYPGCRPRTGCCPLAKVPVTLSRRIIVWTCEGKETRGIGLRGTGMRGIAIGTSWVFPNVLYSVNKYLVVFSAVSN